MASGTMDPSLEVLQTFRKILVFRRQIESKVSALDIKISSNLNSSFILS